MTRPPRIPPVDADTDDPALKPLFDAIRARGGHPLNLHRAVARAPDLLSAFLTFAFALRSSSVSPRVDRELIILRTSQLAGGDYEFAHHRGMAIAFGLTASQVDRVADWRASDLFNDRQRAILSYAEAMFGQDGVDNEVFETLARFFPAQEIVELTLTASFYSGLAQFSRALNVEIDPDVNESRYGR